MKICRRHRAAPLRSPLPRTFCLLISCLFLFPTVSPLQADDEESEEAISAPLEETFLGELVFPQEAGELQISLGLSLGDGETADAVFEWGLTDAWQVEVELGGALSGDVTGLSTVEIGLRYSQMELGAGWHVGAGASFTTGIRDSEDVVDGSISFEPALILAKSWNEGRSHLFTGLSTEWWIDDGDSQAPSAVTPELDDELEWVLGGYRATPWGVGTLELRAERDVEGEEETEWQAAAGWVFPLSVGELGIARAVQLRGDDDDLWLLRWSIEIDTE